MSSVLQVREAWRDTLGAVTHVDGTARLQTVSRESNPRYYSLIHEFGKRTGVPMLLNTSFNNNIEPIVNTADESIACFLTSGLNYLVLGDHLVWKRDSTSSLLRGFRLWLAPCTRLTASRAFTGNGHGETRYALVRNYDETKSQSISADAFRVVESTDGSRSLDDVLASCGLSAEDRRLMDELFGLWSDRFVVVRPLASSPSSTSEASQIP
jgi:carbamoyltransferase